MSIYKKLIFIGLGVETFGVIFALICVIAQVKVSSFVPMAIFTGLITTLISSLMLRKKDDRESNRKHKFYNKLILVSFFTLVLLTVLVTIISVVGS